MSPFDLVGSRRARRRSRGGRIGLAALVLLAVSPAGPAAASLPPPRPTHSYYGPIRICAEYFAIDVRAGEGVEEQGQVVVRSPGHYLGIDHGDGFTGDNYRGLVRPLGELDLAGVGRFRRIALPPGREARDRIFYIYDTGSAWRFAKVQIHADSFDGSARDEALLRRVVTGPAAAAMCADIPEPLRPGPEREDRNALTLRPARHAGPLTVCMAGLAFDVGRGERAMLPWARDGSDFAIIAGERMANVDLQSWRPLSAPALEGPLAADPHVVRIDGRLPSSWGGAASPDRESDRPHVRLVRRADVEAAGQADPIWGVTFTFDRAMTEAERTAMVGRLRARRPRDHCFEADTR